MVFDLSDSIQGPQSCPYAALLMRCDRGKPSIYIDWPLVLIRNPKLQPLLVVTNPAVAGNGRPRGGDGTVLDLMWARCLFII